MAEVYILGQISSAENFEQSPLLCKWSFHTGSGWKVIGGSSEGQTQECRDFYMKNPVWDHPLDLHYTTQTLQGSPKLLVQIFRRDNNNRVLFVGYGIVTIPLTPGSHDLRCHVWKPVGSWQERVNNRLLGTTLQLKNPNLLANSDDRIELLTQSMGSVSVHVDIIAKNFEKFGCQS